MGNFDRLLSLFDAEPLTEARLQSLLRGSDAHRRAAVKLVRRLICADGFTLSVQASDFHGCTPQSLTGPYSHVECACPSSPEAELMPFILDEPGISPLHSSYRQVPVATVLTIVNAHGGLVF